MRSTRKLLLLASLLAALLSAQVPADIAYLLNGVKEVAPGRYGGAICVFGERAFPVLNGRSEGGEEAPIMAAARMGNGRIVVFGHTAYIEETTFTVADTAKLVENTARWAAGEKKSPRVGVYKVPALAKQLHGLGLDARDINLDATASVDVIFLLVRYLTDEEVAPLSEYIRRGGGLVTGAVGWITQGREGYHDLATEFAGNRLIAPAGLIWGTGHVTPVLPAMLRTTQLPAELSHAAKALNALEQRSAGKRTLTEAERRQISTTLGLAAASIPRGNPLLSRIDKVYQPAAPSVRIVFFSPVDLAVPSGVRQRLTQIADSTEKFFFKEMNRWGYPPAVTRLFRREPDGLVEVLKVQGSTPVSSGKYTKPDYADDVIERATRQYHVEGEGHVWWIFVYLGDRPARYQDFRGTGNPRDGGWAMVNYDSVPGEVHPDLGLAEGFNGECFLKGTIHELGHAFGLPHQGPDPALSLGNSLMGPTTAVYAERKFPNAEQVYLTRASAAMLWKHPIFSATARGRSRLPSVKLADYKPVFNPTDDTMTISGKLIADQPAHSVVLIDDQGRPNDEYWVQSHAARIAPDGTFQIKIDQPAKVNGHYRILFCFENGLVTGDGAGVTFGNRGDILKSYSFRKGDFEFADFTESRPVETAAPANVVAQFNLGRDYFAKGDLEQARMQFEAALKLQPDYMPARIALTQFALRRTDPDLALKYVREILKLNPNNGVATLLEAAALLRKGQYDEARALLDKIFKGNPDQADALLELGVLNLMQKRYKDVEEPFRKAYAVDRSNLRGLLGLAEIHFQQNEPDKAVQVIADEVNKQPQRRDLIKELANAEFRAKQYEKAIADYAAIIDQYKDAPLDQADLYARAGTTYATLGNHEKAIENMQKARQLSPSNVGYVATLAQYYDKVGKQQEALAAYRDAMKIDPDNGVVLNNLAYLMTHMGGDLDEALTLANKAKQQLPNLNEVSDTIGCIYIKKHLNDTAIEIFRDLTNKVKDNSTFHYHYGMALAQKGDKAGALQELNAALQYKPDKDEENQIRELIQELSKIQ